jgi:hypothetical protein
MIAARFVVIDGSTFEMNPRGSTPFCTLVTLDS